MGIIGDASNAAGQIYGIISQKAQDRRQIRQQQKLTDQQVEANKKLADYSQGLQMKTWNETNYEAQKEHMEAAGLNPGLMYGMSGGGGATTGGTSAGSATGGQAANSAATQQAQTQAGMNIAQLGIMKAQKENIEADTTKKQAETENIGETTTGQKLANKWEGWLQEAEKLQNGEIGYSPKERQFRITVNKTIGEIQKIDQELNAIGVDINKGTKEIERIKADTALKQQAHEQLEKLNPMEIERVTKELQLYLQDPANTKTAQWANMILGMLGQLSGIGLKGAGAAAVARGRQSQTETSTTTGESQKHGWYEQTTTRKRN